MYCIRCGNRLDEGAAFCSRCGTPVAAGAGQVFAAGGRIAPEDLSPKSRLATTLLAWFLGVYGAHRFYTGHIRTAVGMLAISLLGYAFMIGAFVGMLASIDSESPPALMFVGMAAFWATHMVVWVWMIVDFIMAVTGNFRDSRGKIIRKW